MLKDKLAECPHCRIAPDVVIHYDGKIISGYSVECTTSICAIQPKTKYFKNEKEARAAWNAIYKNYKI